MKDILTRIVEQRVQDIKKSGVTFGFEIPLERKRKVHSFLKAKGVILEVKRASPSKGNIAPDLNSFETAQSYCKSGAGAISCLTETNYFKGTLQDLMNVCSAVDEYERTSGVTGPAVLRKDFLVSEEEVDVAYRAGADAVLLISRILTKEKMASMAERAASYGMTSLIEIRLDEDIEKLKFVCERVDRNFIACGVNSRDLSDFKIDLLTPCRMLEKIRSVLGSEARVIFESGIRTPESAAFVGSMGFGGLLLGEAAAKNPSIRKSLVDSFVNSQGTAHALFWNKFASDFSGLHKNKKCLVKICGLTDKEDVKKAVELGADFLGFIFYDKSPRHINADCAENIISAAGKNKKLFKIGVIVDPEHKEAETAIELCRRGVLDALQLHTAECARKFLRDDSLKSLPHYAAVNISDESDVSVLDELFDLGEPRVLVDACTAEKKGGTGKQISCELVRLVQKKYPLWIAGGITPENVDSIIKDYSPELADCASGVESEPGKKDFSRLELFFNNVK